MQSLEFQNLHGIRIINPFGCDVIIPIQSRCNVQMRFSGTGDAVLTITTKYRVIEAQASGAESMTINESDDGGLEFIGPWHVSSVSGHAGVDADAESS